MPPQLPNILKGLADNPDLFAAVKEVILKQFTLDAANVYMLDNNEIGQIVRARIDGRKLVEEAFREIELHKTPPKREEEKNPAR